MRMLMGFILCVFVVAAAAILCGWNTFFVCLFIFIVSHESLFSAHIAHNLFPTFVRVIAYADRYNANLAEIASLALAPTRKHTAAALSQRAHRIAAFIVMVIVFNREACEHCRLYLSV